ncbi:MAG: VOC family protein [Motiliproteus sp.]|nr:VOC family protein [Motiliproteus sp.]MCW9052941.1 VOC family protein [Motiliproteus sp.]
MKLSQLDHLVLTVADIEPSVDFYCRVLGMEKIVFGEQRIALKFGQQKINLHQQGKEFEPKANHPTPGSADLCFLTDTPIRDAMTHVSCKGVNILEGPVERTGAEGPILSFYFRDPDGNLIEVSNTNFRHNSPL